MKKIKVLLADDHQLIRDGIKAILSSVKDIIIVGEAKNGKEVIEQTSSLKPDVVIMDIAMPGISGIEATKIIKKDMPETKVLALTQHENDEYIYQILMSGGSGYLLKNTRKEEFIDAIHAVTAGERYFSKKISNLILQNYLKPDKPKATLKQEGADEIVLTKREIEVIKLIAEENSNQEIADKLFISLRTVETHRRNIMQKLKINSVIALLKYAVQNGMISIDNESDQA